MIIEMDRMQITVSELTRRVGIHRKTFYLHYETLDDLVYFMADDIASQMKEMISGIFDTENILSLESYISGYSDVLAKNPELHRQLFTNRSYSYLYNYIVDDVCNFFSEKLKASIDCDDETTELLAYFVAYGLNGMFRHCFMTGQPTDSEAVNSWVASLGDTILMKKGRNHVDEGGVPCALEA